MPRVAADQREALAATRRDQIIEAAIRCWLAKGYDATSVSAIAREAELAKGTLYLYFPTKQDMLDEAINRYSMLPDLRVFLAAARGTPSETTIPTLIRGLWHALLQRVDQIRFFVREVSVRPEHAKHFLQTVVLPSNEALAEHFAPEIENGALRPVNMFIASRALLGMLMIFLFTQEVFGGKELMPIDDDEIVATVSDLFLYGIVPREGGEDA
jgi:AcrR family transcriptional regulator